MTELEYSDEGKAARDLFVSEFTDYIFYVEDTGAEIFYERIVNRLFPRLTSFEVECLHGKSNVLKKTSEKRVDGLSYVFIVDKDFDDLLDVEECSEVVYLRKYSIENYLSDVNALAKVYVEEVPQGKTLKVVLSELPGRDAYLHQLHTALIECTRCFVVIRRFWLELESSKCSLDTLLCGADEDYPMPTNTWIDSFKAKICEESGLDSSSLDAELSNAFNPSGEFSFSTAENESHIPGKHLLGCLLRYFSKHLNFDIESKLGKRLYTRLLNHIEPQRFGPVRDSILAKQPTLSAYLE